VPVGDRCQICGGKKPTPQVCFPPTHPPHPHRRKREAVYQSQERTCSGNDAELIAFNPDAADNLEASSLRQRRAESMEEGGGGDRERDTDRKTEGQKRGKKSGRDRKTNRQDVGKEGRSRKRERV